jgi:hypothetical protein
MVLSAVETTTVSNAAIIDAMPVRTTTHVRFLAVMLAYGSRDLLWFGLPRMEIRGVAAIHRGVIDQLGDVPGGAKSSSSAPTNTVISAMRPLVSSVSSWRTCRVSGWPGQPR